jgi:hypothetical protein
LGSSVLEWLRSPKYIGSLPKQSHLESALMRYLTWHLVAEGKENLAVDLINQATTEKSCSHRLRHRLKLLPSGLVNAHLVQSKDGSANEALLYYFELKRRIWSGKNDSGFFVSASAALDMWLESVETLPCNADMYDRFVEDQYAMMRGGRMVQQRAKLLLYHPSRSDPWPYHESTLDALDHRKQKSYSKPAWRNIGTNALRASYVIRLLGHQDVANSFESTILDSFRDLSKVRGRIMTDLSRDPKLDLLRSSS